MSEKGNNNTPSNATITSSSPLANINTLPPVPVVITKEASSGSSAKGNSK